jgi:hypothetical protein
MYSKPESLLESKMSHIHSSHSSIGKAVGDVNICYTPTTMVICTQNLIKVTRYDWGPSLHDR